jgi:hypothetical protein
MAATVIINRFTGTSAGTKTAITGINTRANAEDAHSTAGTSNSILVPAAGNNYSFWVTTKLEVTAITGGTVNNIKWYTDGSNNFGTGVTALVALASTGANAGYRQATGTTGTTGTVLNGTNHTGLDGAPVDPFTYTSGSPLSITGTTSTAADVGTFVVYQIVVASTASSGATGSETFTFQYDDTSS